tara:strand:+ start:3197 stop:3559 length:363 start_codon:yes stop_codon:yes gene_type:complete
MNREIKFRAWDKAGNQIRWEAPSQSGALGEIIRPETIGQFTGLLDRNGTEIYEGDIVQREKVLDGPERIYWEDGSFYVGHNDKETFYLDEPFHSLLNLDMEVVGNIYKNPELIQNNEKDL